MAKKKKRGSKGLRIAVIIMFLLGLVAGGIGYWIVYQPNVKLSDPTLLYVRTGASFDEVMDSLEKKNIIKNRDSFSWLASQKNYPSNIKPGRYRIKPGMSNNDLINMLRSGKQEPVKLTFNNIRKKEDFAGRIGRQIEADSASILNSLNDLNTVEKYGFNPENILTMFIPNTYEVKWNMSAEQFMERMNKEYKKFWTPEKRAKAEAQGLNPIEATILASIVEKETLKDDERPRIAGVYLNRLKKGIKLEADPTLVWAMNDFTIKRVLNVHKRVNSPYNTYMYAGLPPGPIYIPSISSINAVLNPEQHKYLFFCAKEDFSGYSNFAETLAEHEANARRYRAALDKMNIRK